MLMKFGSKVQIVLWLVNTCTNVLCNNFLVFCLIDAVRFHDNRITDKEVATYIAIWFESARDRDGGRARRMPNVQIDPFVQFTQ